MNDELPVVPIRIRDFLALSADHPLRDTPCGTCGEVLGDSPVTLMAVGPMDDEDQGRHDAGLWYSAGGVMVHTGDCVNHFDPEDLWT